MGNKVTNSMVPLNLEFIKIWMKVNKNREVVQQFFENNNSFIPTTFEIIDINH